MAVMAAMAARQVMVRSEWTVVCRLWSLMLIRRKRVGVRQCGGDGEGGRAGAGESSRAMAAMAMMAVMAGDNERRAAAKEQRRQQAASSVSPWAKGGGSSGGEVRRKARPTTPDLLSTTHVTDCHSVGNASSTLSTQLTHTDRDAHNSSTLPARTN